MKTFTVKIDNSDIQSSHEKASFNVTSPSGKTIWLYKKNLGKMTDEQRKIFWQFCGNPLVRFTGEKEATRDELVELLKISKL